MMNGFNEFCGNISLWDEELLLNSSWPHFTDCFQQTLLTWTPCAFLWLTAPYYIWYLLHTRRINSTMTWLNISKMVISLVLCLIILVQVIKLARSQITDKPTSLYFAYGLTAASYLYACILFYLERLYGLVTSGIQFVYWLLTTFINIVPLYTSIMQGIYYEDPFNFSLTVIHYIMLLSIFFLQFFADTQKFDRDLKEITPSMTVSFPNRLSFWWAQKMISTGYKTPLTPDDFFPLHPKNLSKNVVPRFKKSWTKEKDRINQHNRKRQKSLVQADVKDEQIPLVTEQETTTSPLSSTVKTSSNFQPKENGSHVIINKIFGRQPSDDAKSELESLEMILYPEQLQSSVDAKVLGTILTENSIHGSSHTISEGLADSKLMQRISVSGSSYSVNGPKKDPNQYSRQNSVILAKSAGGGSENVQDENKNAKGKESVQSSNDGKKKEDAFKTTSGDKKSSLFNVLATTFWAPFLQVQILQLICTLLQFVSPKLLGSLLHYVTNRQEYQPWIGYVLACCFFLTSNLMTIFGQNSWHTIQRTMMMVRSALVSAVYEKSLNMSYESKRHATIGEIVNLMVIDCQRIQDVIQHLVVLWSGPLTIAIALYQLWAILGISTLAGLVVLILSVPFNSFIIRHQRRIHLATLGLKDKRIKLMAQVLNGIKVIKLYAWEELFQDKVLEIRNQELKNLRSAAIYQGGLVFMWTLVPYLVALASFTVYILASDHNSLDPVTAFVSLSLFNLMRFPINMLPGVVPAVVQAHISLNRVSSFLNWEDIHADNIRKDPNASQAVSIQNGTFTWDLSFPRATLKNINLFIPEGKVVAIVGPVGCGKSSLLASMLGEMSKLSGTVTVKSSIAYVPQEAWIQNATVRDNILFGKKMKELRYNQVIKACALQTDMEILVGGDMTEIGEKGINLSGGQRQRVSLARAVYSDADIYLLDDPLSAVDSHVGKHIFQHVIGNQGVLATKTRILVTHGVHWLPMTDLVVVMKDGSISEIGTYEELMAKEGDFAEFLNTYLTRNDESDEENEEDEEITEIKNQMRFRLASFTSKSTLSVDDRSIYSLDLEGRKRRHTHRQTSLLSSSQKSLEVEKTKQQKQEMWRLIVEEEFMTGNVDRGVYLMYVKALGGFGWVCILLWYVIYQASALTSNIWLSQWTDNPVLANISLAGTQEYQRLNVMYLGVYGALGVIQAVFVVGYNMMSNVRMVRAAGRLHATMLFRILRSPMSFFETTPVGRILSRFSRDVDVCDTVLPMSFRQTINTAGIVVTTIILIAYSSPIFLAVVAPLAVLYRLLQKYYISSSRQAKRLDSTTRSPIYTHFTETIQGAMSIRAYGASARFIKESQERVDKNLICFYAFVVSQRWLGVRMEFMGSLITLAAAVCAVINQGLSSGLVGLSITYAMNVTMVLHQLVVVSSELETNIVSAERIKDYSERETEAEWKGPKYPPDRWPEEGQVEFKDYETRYRPGLDLVIRGLTCSVRGGEKVGIVGRTGAGKSSLTLSLFRIIEAAGGKIIIDGETIADIGLHDLRGRLTILPQDAFVFSGTLRVNLDPSGKHSDDQIWAALDHSHLSSFVRGLPGQLDYECGEGGQNLSAGQRQLLCLARSLLRKSKVLVLDEATAAVDMETDDLIQKTIRSEFKGSTVLTIAHRLNTIMDYDRIMVLDQGKIAEFASPTELLSNPTSYFYGMAKSAGLV